MVISTAIALVFINRLITSKEFRRSLKKNFKTKNYNKNFDAKKEIKTYSDFTEVEFLGI